MRADSSTATEGEWQLRISDDYVRAVEFAQISPQPDSAQRVAAGIEYTFTQAQPQADLEVTFSLTPDSLWGATGELELAGREVTVQQFFFP